MLIKILLVIFFIYTIFSLLYSFKLSMKIAMPKRLIPPLIFFGSIFLFSAIARFVSNDTIVAAINISGMVVGETLALVFSLKQSKQ